MMRKSRRKVERRNDVYSWDVGRWFDRFSVGIVDFLQLKGVGLIGS